MAGIAGTDDDNERGYPATGMAEYLRHKRMLDGPDVGDRNVAVIVLAGEITGGEQPPGTVGAESTARMLREARRDETIKAVVLRIDSPGGGTFASELIRDEIVALREAGKPVVASMGSLAASAGYYLSAATDEIFAHESTITGSIGVIVMSPTFDRTFAELGIATDGVGSTAWAAEFRGDRPLSDQRRQFLQQMTDTLYRDFVSSVADYRGMSFEEADRVAQGQVWTGTTAVDYGLVDALGGLEDAITRAADLAELGDEDYGIR